MGSLPPELSLDITPPFVPKTIRELLEEVSAIGDSKDKLSKFNAFVGGLEEEMKKIDAFKRELPLCVLLLTDVIMFLKEKAKQCMASIKLQPVLEEFIPLKKKCDKEEGEALLAREENDSKDKKNWMSSVQLWNVDENPSTDHNTLDQKQNLRIESKANRPVKVASQYRNEDIFQASCSRNEARTFLPLKAYPVEENDKREKLPIPGLSLLTPGIKHLREESRSASLRSSCNRPILSSASHLQSNLRNGPHIPQQQQVSRKQRRCWSPELHRRFVNALHQLGGCQAATPKQIRELMQVDGLTNDEVKSHLQKFRLHTRRIPLASPAPANQSTVVLGSLWMSQEQHADSAKGPSSQSGSPQGPLQLAGNTGGDSMEDDEDEKSEDYSRKEHISRSGRDDV